MTPENVVAGESCLGGRSFSSDKNAAQEKGL